jgi:TonB family protein
MRVTLSHLLLLAVGISEPAQGSIAAQVGYIYCGKDAQKSSVPVFFNACTRRQVGSFPCGHQIEVVADLGGLLKVKTFGGSLVFVDSNDVSQKVDEFTPVAIDAELPPDCKVKVPERDPVKNRGPRVVFNPQPDYPSTAPRSHDENFVDLSLVVGVDGQPRNIKVESSPRKDFAKSAIETVRKWKFEPALKDGEPVEMPIKVQIAFRLLY